MTAATFISWLVCIIKIMDLPCRSLGARRDKIMHWLTTPIFWHNNVLQALLLQSSANKYPDGVVQRGIHYMTHSHTTLRATPHWSATRWPSTTQWFICNFCRFFWDNPFIFQFLLDNNPSVCNCGQKAAFLLTLIGTSVLEPETFVTFMIRHSRPNRLIVYLLRHGINIRNQRQRVSYLIMILFCADWFFIYQIVAPWDHNYSTNESCPPLSSESFLLILGSSASYYKRCEGQHYWMKRQTGRTQSGSAVTVAIALLRIRLTGTKLCVRVFRHIKWFTRAATTG